ncbi:MAG: hypothetical protein ACK53A_00305 [Gemmatimonadota bacterium]
MPQQSTTTNPQNVRIKIGTDGVQITGVEQSATAPEAAALQAQVGMLRQRVEQLKEERTSLVEEANAPGNRETQTAVRDRLTTVQTQLAQNETALRAAEDRLAALGIAPSDVTVAETRADPPTSHIRDIPDNIMGLGMVSLLFIGAPLAIGISRWLWRRAVPAPAPAFPAIESQRLARLEQSVEAIAVELERVSEGQRFVTKLFAEQRGLSAGAAEPVRVPQADAVSRP